MARFAAAERATGTITTAHGPSLYATASGGGISLREVGVFNTTTSAVAVELSVASTQAATPGTALTEVNVSNPTGPVAASGEARNTGSGTAPTITGGVRQASLGAAIGAGIIWTFGDHGLIIPEGTANGVIITCPAGTMQLVDFYFEWEE